MIRGQRFNRNGCSPRVVSFGRPRKTRLMARPKSLGRGLINAQPAVKLPVKRIIVGPADGVDERSRALSRRLQ